MSTVIQDIGECPNDSRGWHLWSARFPFCTFCETDLRHVCLCDSVGRCPVHNPHPEQSDEPRAKT
jgi:hypothetical protein